MVQPWRLNAAKQVEIREEWLALGEGEEILDPARPIVDPHHHLWDRHDETYLLPDLLRDTGSGHDIRATVFIQCASMYRPDGPEALKPLGETEFVNGIAAAAASGTYGRTLACAGIVGFADLLLGDAVAPVLEAHVAIAGARFRGVRNRTAWHPDPGVRSNLITPPPGPLAEPAFAAGARRLAALGLTLDVWAYHTQLGDVLALAKAVPEVTVVVNHIGGALGVGPFAGRRAEVFAPWREAMRALAALPNLRVKIGGLAMEVTGYDFHHHPLPPASRHLAEAWKPWVETVIELFGARRCMFESNFPVDKGMAGYVAVWNAFKRLAAGAGEAEKDALFAGTAIRTYQLAGVPGGAALAPLAA
ncbi:amidohydrolase family protein [Falsiroseomonas ponticola]|uniref:amidohydrolase family protein n=1 Tax=Falsiroseomonas ponticola TaxID=2786951 RepID=UPI001CF7A8D0|nr:amidohydrolase family protein [Roseomonas ponticola]